MRFSSLAACPVAHRWRRLGSTSVRCTSLHCVEWPAAVHLLLVLRGVFVHLHMSIAFGVLGGEFAFA
eukprot:scaffold59585_cov36-Phaeocystis_antarctica.AAC.1